MGVCVGNFRNFQPWLICEHIDKTKATFVIFVKKIYVSYLIAKCRAQSNTLVSIPIGILRPIPETSVVSAKGGGETTASGMSCRSPTSMASRGGLKKKIESLRHVPRGLLQEDL